MAIAALGITACGSDEPASATSQPAAPTATEAPAPIAALTGVQICERLTVASVAADTGLNVTDATADDSGTPQCAYSYKNDSEMSSNLTVASMRPSDVADRSGSDAFDYVVEVNQTMAGADSETQKVSAGDSAVRISGTLMHLGVLEVGDQILTLIVPAGDIETDAVDHLIATMATALG